MLQYLPHKNIYLNASKNELKHIETKGTIQIQWDVNELPVTLQSILSCFERYLVLPPGEMNGWCLREIEIRYTWQHNFSRLTSAIFSWSPSKFCISLEQAVKPLLRAFSTQTVAASCFWPSALCSAVNKMYGTSLNACRNHKTNLTSELSWCSS